MHVIAILADIHANLPALLAVEADLRARGVTEVVVAGDLIGRGPMGTAVVQHVQRAGWRCVRGNHEDYVLGFKHGRVPPAWLVTEEWAALRWMGRELSDEAGAFCEALPLQFALEEDPHVVVVHGSPNSYNEGLGVWTPEGVLDAHLDAVGATCLVCAHTHRPMLREVGARSVVNVGSVGLPFNGDVRAQYAILETDGEQRTVTLHQVEYDRAAILDVYDASGFLDQGAITAHLLRLEVETARPHLVPYLAWTRATEREASLHNLPDFLDMFDCHGSLPAFFSSLGMLRPTP